jgi:hypothetical protein
MAVGAPPTDRFPTSAHATARPPCSTRLRPVSNPLRTLHRTGSEPLAPLPRSGAVGQLEHVDAGDPVAHEEPEDEWWVDRPEVAEKPVAEDDVVEGGAGSGERGNVDSTVEAEEYVRQDVVLEDGLHSGAVGSGPDRRQRGPRGGRQRLNHTFRYPLRVSAENAMILRFLKGGPDSPSTSSYASVPDAHWR